MDDEMSSTPARPIRTILRWLGAAAAIAAIVGAVFQVIEWAGSRSAPSGQVTGGVDAGDTPKANGDEQFIQVGQCVRNTGSTESPVYEKATCGTGTFRVLARIEQAVADEDEADALCAERAPGYTEYHYSNWAKRSDYLDIVFCVSPA